MDDRLLEALALARLGDADEAFHTLRELGAEHLLAMQAACRDELDPDTRALIVDALWERRDPSVIGFLSEMLRDKSPAVWKEALDGLVAMSSDDTLRVLQAALGEADPIRRSWIEEALEQVTEALADPAQDRGGIPPARQ